MNRRLLPPLNVQMQTLSVDGRSYSGTPGQVLDVPDFDAGQLEANGWTPIAQSGTTAQRPALAAVARGTHYFDTTLAALIAWDGATWRNPATGAAA